MKNSFNVLWKTKLNMNTEQQLYTKYTIHNVLQRITYFLAVFLKDYCNKNTPSKNSYQKYESGHFENLYIKSTI